MSRLDRRQREALRAYRRLDPGSRVIGYHCGRPVLHTHVCATADRGEHTRRHVLVLKRNGNPDRPPLDWRGEWTEFPGIPLAEVAELVDAAVTS